MIEVLPPTHRRAFELEAMTGTTIPRRLIRTVPNRTSPEVERFWTAARALHPTWELITARDPLDPTDFPLTGPSWPRCSSGAQLAGLIRLEALVVWGGVYVDSDVELYRPLDALLGVQAFAGWEDDRTVPDAVIGAEPSHPGLEACLDLALERVHAGEGAWATGPGVTTSILPGRDDVLLLPPGSFYPYHYTERARRHEDHRGRNPWAFGAHHWAASWLPPDQRT